MFSKTADAPSGAAAIDAAFHEGTPRAPLASETGAAPAAVAGQTVLTHCPYRQATLLQQALVSNKMRVGALLGAGCPLAIRVPNGAWTKPLIPDIAGLTAEVRANIEASQKYKGHFDKIIKRLADGGTPEPNVEGILSHVRALHDVIGTSTIDGLSKSDLDELDIEICRVTNEVVKARLPSNMTPYHHLATWIGAISRAHAVEIFTSNYDLLMEQALEERRVPYFDGFVGADRTFFDLASMEADNLPSRWARLWKVHGSINWWRTKTDEIQRRADGQGDRLLIHPSHLKYDQSRRMPYLAMLDRLRAFLSAGQVVLITCGFSFTDEHITDAIVQGLSSNPKAICFGLLFGDRSKSPKAVAQARRYANLSLLAADGAVLGTVERDWHTIEKTEHAFHGMAVRTGELLGRSDSPAGRCKFLLGDFRSFGDFLAHELSLRDDTDHGRYNS